MNWNTLTTIAQLETIVNSQSHNEPILLFKHSTRCSISTASLSRVERNWKEDDNSKIQPYYLDLLQHRDVSNHIATLTGVEHASPQVLIIKEGKCVYDASHSDIRYDDIMENV
ncbi:MAG: bacillithiol system redox-active protein YtxJ [Bacteroidia bacterium]